MNTHKTRIETPEVETIDGLLSFDECRKSIEYHAHNINMDVSSQMVNNGRIKSLRSLLSLFELYNNKLNLIKMENTMYVSEWELEEDGSYYQATVSLKENLTPFLKIRVIPLDYQKEFNLVVRDYNSGLLLASKSLEMEQKDNGMYINLDTAKEAITKMARMYFIGEGGICTI